MTSKNSQHFVQKHWQSHCSLAFRHVLCTTININQVQKSVIESDYSNTFASFFPLQTISAYELHTMKLFLFLNVILVIFRCIHRIWPFLLIVRWYCCKRLYKTKIWKCKWFNSIRSATCCLRASDVVMMFVITRKRNIK